MPYFIRMPRPTEAKQFTAENYREILAWLQSKNKDAAVVRKVGGGIEYLILNPVNPPMRRNAPVGAWLAFDPDYPYVRILTDTDFKSQYAPT